MPETALNSGRPRVPAVAAARNNRPGKKAAGVSGGFPSRQR
jgi:hypothetical protein